MIDFRMKGPGIVVLLMKRPGIVVLYMKELDVFVFQMNGSEEKYSG